MSSHIEKEVFDLKNFLIERVKEKSKDLQTFVRYALAQDVNKQEDIWTNLEPLYRELQNIKRDLKTDYQ